MVLVLHAHWLGCAAPMGGAGPPERDLQQAFSDPRVKDENLFVRVGITIAALGGVARWLLETDHGAYFSKGDSERNRERERVCNRALVAWVVYALVNPGWDGLRGAGAAALNEWERVCVHGETDESLTASPTSYAESLEKTWEGEPGLWATYRAVEAETQHSKLREIRALAVGSVVDYLARSPESDGARVRAALPWKMEAQLQRLLRGDGIDVPLEWGKLARVIQGGRSGEPGSTRGSRSDEILCVVARATMRLTTRQSEDPGLHPYFEHRERGMTIALETLKAIAEARARSSCAYFAGIGANVDATLERAGLAKVSASLACMRAESIVAKAGTQCDCEQRYRPSSGELRRVESWGADAWYAVAEESVMAHHSVGIPCDDHSPFDPDGRYVAW